ncbi:MAG: DUF4422 domain-containing protein [Butyrivibrio sp.]|nr:DUF4422 domain-containing protein [Butyrivibrio sp.]
MAKVKIIVATTKKYRMPDDGMYMPVQVGAEKAKILIPEYEKDNSSEDNISAKNSQYCELTGLYWAWKNVDADFIGLVHYRRYFGSKHQGVSSDPFEKVIKQDELDEILKKSCVVVPTKRKYYIETLHSHYSHTHYEEQLVKTKSIIERKYPEYLESYEKAMSQTSGYMFNMMIMRRDILNKYCRWLFDILDELEKELIDNKLDAYQGRYIGRVGELIFNVWLDHQMATGEILRYQVQELPCIHMERINWFKKGAAFLRAKLFHKKYDHSF